MVGASSFRQSVMAVTCLFTEDLVRQAHRAWFYTAATLEDYRARFEYGDLFAFASKLGIEIFDRNRHAAADCELMF
jgi:hypothetical protein